MQTGTSGCQYSWLTICLLLLFVFCYQHQQQHTLTFNDLSTFTTTTTTTTTTTAAPILLITKIMNEEEHLQQIMNINTTTTNQTNISTETWPTSTRVMKLHNEKQVNVQSATNKFNIETTLINIEKIVRNLNVDNNDNKKKCLILTDLSDKVQLDTLYVSENILCVKVRQQEQHENLKIFKQTKILPPMLMLMLMIMNVHECKVDNVDGVNNKCSSIFVIIKGRDEEIRRQRGRGRVRERHALSTRETTLQQQQQKYVQILTSKSTTVFGSVTAALVHLTTWPAAVMLLLLSYIKNPAKASTLTTHHCSNIAVLHNYRPLHIANIFNQNVVINNETN